MNSYEKAEKLCTIFSLLAIPVLIATGGWLVQKSLNSKSIQSDYVKLAVDILKERTDKDNPQLRRWAAETLALYSEIPFSDTEMSALKDGSITLPATTYTFDEKGRVKSVKYNNEEVVKYSYDGQGVLIQVNSDKP
ncbi:RHS repeat protein [Colwellia sp. BRX10-6]|uniref:RHS repeat protein n=1 Tax=unclassified Colwellia TaxID=196834 RepID=UPI0015F55629|nr:MULTISPECIES: RHS repeat protein [unclassified Colwellia]MBA6383649.1 RHS repeat protein [Colwellia sp. BRX10-9]MBA6394359.1 RHS repeat protein [Colwellia sp. BRX10-6]